MLTDTGRMSMSDYTLRYIVYIYIYIYIYIIIYIYIWMIKLMHMLVLACV